MNSILQKNEFIKCPYCSNLIGSFSPVCSKCGLEASEGGIEELAEIDERNRQALADAENLLMYATAPIVYLGVAYLLEKLIPEASITYTAIAMIPNAMFWWKYLRWHRSYSENPFPDDNFDSAKRTRTVAGVWGIVVTLVIILFVYWKVS